MLIYFDSVIVIYLFDHTGPFNVRATARLAALQAAGDSIGASDLSRLECRVHPIRLGDVAKLAVFDRATHLRATHNFALADALHLAAAIEAGCDRFLTNDARLSRCTDVPVEVLP